MKKLIAIFISIVLAMVSLFPVLLTEADSIILGLDEQLDEICLNSGVNAEIRSKIQELYTERLEYRVTEAMKNPDYAKEKMGVVLGDDAYESEQLRYMFSLDVDKGILITLLDTIEYSMQYAQEGCLSYLFNEKKVFQVPGMVHDGGTFSTNGNRLTGSELTYAANNSPTVVTIESIVNYLNSRETLSDELLQRGETIVNDVVLYGCGYLTLLYIKCGNNEYLVKLYESSGDILPEIEPFMLYTAEELMSEFNNEEVKSSPYSQGVAQKVLAEKPTFESEAQSLQSAGLLQGNENGLDLLKPLTRIEAATMLLRAMGESTESRAEVQTFTDVPSAHWGYGAAENAYSLGLIKGVGEDRFAPDDKVTAPQFATMLLRAGNHAEFNWEEAVNILIEENVITAENAATMDFFTRGDMAKMIYEAMAKEMF